MSTKSKPTPEEVLDCCMDIVSDYIHVDLSEEELELLEGMIAEIEYMRDWVLGGIVEH